MLACHRTIARNSAVVDSSVHRCCHSTFRNSRLLISAVDKAKVIPQWERVRCSQTFSAKLNQASMTSMTDEFQDGCQSDPEEKEYNHKSKNDTITLNYHEYSRWSTGHQRHLPQKPNDWWKRSETRTPVSSREEQPSFAEMQTKKVSKHGNAESLFLDCLDRIRDARRHTLGNEDSEGVHTRDSPEIQELSKLEKSIIYKILKRVDPSKEVALNLEYSGDYIDPYWNPFKPVGDIKKEIHDDFSQYARLRCTAEALHQQEQLRRKYRIEYNLIDPLKSQKDKNRLDSSIPDDPKYPQFVSGIPEKLWDPSSLRRRALFNNNRPITWRDLHILKFFIAENGMFLPRRLTMATRRQQVRAFKAVKQAQCLGVFPYDWKPADTEQMILQDPMQFMADILTLRYKERGDLRAEAMIRSMMKRFKNVDYRQ